MWDQIQWQDGQEGSGAEQKGSEESGERVQKGDGVPIVHCESGQLKELGYVFALAVVRDTKPASQLFAVAGARYNSVKICV